MGFIYKQWLVSVVPAVSEEAWTFYVRSPSGEYLSNHQKYSSIALAQEAARRHIDRHLLLNEVVRILDRLSVRHAISTTDYVRCLEIFKTLANDDPVEEPVADESA